MVNKAKTKLMESLNWQIYVSLFNLRYLSTLKILY